MKLHRAAVSALLAVTTVAAVVGPASASPRSAAPPSVEDEPSDFAAHADALAQKVIDAVEAVEAAASSRLSAAAASAEEDGEQDQQRGLMEHTMFQPLTCNADLDYSAACATLSSLFASTPAGDQVTVPCGTCATLDVADGSRIDLLGGLNIEGKLLVPSSASATLRTTHVYVQGELKIEAPADGNVVEFLLFGTDDEYMMPHMQNMHACDMMTGCKVGKKAFVTAGGKLDIRGLSTPTCPSWVKLQDVDSTSTPGVKSGPVDIIKVGTEAASCWKAGDEILITSPDVDMNARSVATIASIDAAAGELTLTSAPVDLFYEASAAADEDFAVEVARLTRSVIVTAEEDDLHESGDGLLGGHFIILHTPHVKQYIEGVEFRNMGQQGNMGRYSIHFHMCDDVTGSVVSKNVVRDSNQRAVVIHGTHNVIVDNNVAFEVFGHGFFTEDGVERDVTFSYNLGASFHAPSHLIDHPADGPESDARVATFWITVTENNHWIGNVAAGSGHSGFWFDTRITFRGKTSQPLFNRDKNLGTFKDNTAHSSQMWGFMWYSPGWSPLEYNVIENTMCYRNGVEGHFIHNNRNLHFKGGLIADNPSGATRTLDNVKNVTMSHFRIMGYTDNYAAIRKKRRGTDACAPYLFRTLFFHSKSGSFPELPGVGITLEDTTFTHGSRCPTPALQMEPGHIARHAATPTLLNIIKNVTFPSGWAGPRFSKCQVAEPDLNLKLQVADGASSPTGSAGFYVSDDAGLKSAFAHCFPPEEGSCAVFCQDAPYVSTASPTPSPTPLPTPSPFVADADSTAADFGYGDDRIMLGKAASASASSVYPVGNSFVPMNLFDEDITLADVGLRPANLGNDYAGQAWSPFVAKLDMGEVVGFNALYYAQRGNPDRVVEEIQVRAYLEDPGDVGALKDNMSDLKDPDAVFAPDGGNALEEYPLGPDLLVARYVVLTLTSSHPDTGGSALRLGFVPGQTRAPSPAPVSGVELFNLARGKTATQRTTVHGGTADRAVDGNTDGNWGGGSVVHGGGNDWWSVDLGGMYELRTVKIYNRLDCCKDQLNNIRVLIFDDANNIVKYITLISDSADTVTWELDEPVLGKIVQVHNSATLMMAEVEVFGVLDLTNLALGKSASQSATAHGGTADRAVDGNTDGNWAGGSVAHGGGNGWWRVDLGGLNELYSINIYNRLDCCMDLLDSINVVIFDEDSQIVTSKAIRSSSADVITWEFDRPVLGKFVQIENSEVLLLAEVEVIGILRAAPATDPDIVNLALHQPAEQKSSPFAPMGTADKAVDGNTDGNWGANSVTHGGGNDWWTVDLGGMHSIHFIKIYNRLDCCMDRLDNINVLIFNEANEVVTQKTVSTISAIVAVWNLDVPVDGRHVRVENSQILSMAEVEVVGKRASRRQLLRGKEE